jgi:polyhydroxybutyrate depolymerase
MNIKYSCMWILISGVVLLSTVACGSAAPSLLPVPTSTPPQLLMAPATTVQPGDFLRILSVNGEERTYRLHIPLNLQIGKPAPLVFVFHGLSDNADLIEQISGFNDFSEKDGVVVVYPNGTGPSGSLSWNASGCCGYAMTNKIDESAFIRNIIDDLGKIAEVDPKRIYATGFSNGGLLSYRLACEMSNTFAAIGPVAGALITQPCQPDQPVSVIQFSGMTDSVVPYSGGGIVPGSGRPFPSAETSVSTWAKLDSCGISPKTEETEIFVHTQYSSCKDGTAVELYAVKGIGHSWPSQYVIPASQIIWDFFKAHPKQ